MKLKPTTFDIGQTVTVKGPRPGQVRQMTINEIIIHISSREKVLVKYGFKESLWTYSERMIEPLKKKQTSFDFMDDLIEGD